MNAQLASFHITRVLIAMSQLHINHASRCVFCTNIMMVTFQSDLQPSIKSIYTQVVIVSDETASISAEVRAASDAYEIVITAGGVGPTRDDVTLAGVAEALGKPLVR